MSLPYRLFQPGDPVFHPRFGLGTVHALARRDRIDPIQESRAADRTAEPTEDYYEIELVEGGTLQVPVGRADSLGLRRASNGLDAVRDCLCSEAESLPADARERAAILRTREQILEPEALAYTVRDMLAYSQGRALSASERTWLDKACQRLSAEVALVDRISPAQAKSAVLEVVTQLRGIPNKV
jgi:RNA polymerase-interacting CarD/CdnL/TRCF family regulator